MPNSCRFQLPVPSRVPLPGDVSGRGLENECAGALSVAKSSDSTTTWKHFAPPKTEKEIEKTRTESIPKKTREDTVYCVRLWLSWSEYRATTTGVPVPSLAVLSATTEDLQVLAYLLYPRSPKEEWSGVSTQYFTSHHLWNHASHSP